MTLALEAVSLRVDGQTQIHPTALALAERGFNTLLGETLAGKTTLLRLMAGLVPPSSGRLTMRGRDVTGVAVQKRRVSMVYQQFINYPNLDVFENIASPLRVQRLPQGEVRRRVGEIAELLQLSALLDRRPAELSGGQQQRAALARALVKDSELVLLDEPLANLDYKLREALRDELPRLFADRGCLVVYATTEPSEALLLGGHVATLHEGRVTQFGPAAAVYRAPADLVTARVFSDPPINVVPARLRGGRVELGDGTGWPAPAALAAADGPIQLALRPHHVRAVHGRGAARDTTGDAAVRVRGRVQISEINGSESVVHFELGGATWVSLMHGVQEYPVGEVAAFELDVAQALHFSPAGQRLQG
ncbi:MAG: ABC transporter ATP-binding protein [Burkholderiales bacterium]|nr:ABC transporter ATP-binding protein [Burkholderiales bacterium]